jgi:hypothetical protein
LGGKAVPLDQSTLLKSVAHRPQRATTERLVPNADKTRSGRARIAAVPFYARLSVAAKRSTAFGDLPRRIVAGNRVVTGQNSEAGQGTFSSIGSESPCPL